MYTASNSLSHLKYLLMTVVILTYVYKLFYTPLAKRWSSVLFSLNVDLVIHLLKLRKEKNRNFTVKKPGRHYLNQVIKFNITHGKSY